MGYIVSIVFLVLLLIGASMLIAADYYQFVYRGKTTMLSKIGVLLASLSAIVSAIIVYLK